MQIILQEKEKFPIFVTYLGKMSGILAKNKMFFESRVMKRAACAALALVPEDVPIDLGVIRRTNVTEKTVDRKLR